MKHSLGIQVRFCDTDALGHLNNSTYAQYAELGRIALFGAAKTEVKHLILARLEIDFKQQVKFKQQVRIESWISSIGNSSVRVNHDILADESLACSIESVVVFFDFNTDKPMRVPDDVREKLSVYGAD